MTREFVAGFINREFARPQSNKVLHAHPSPKHWRPSKDMGRRRWEKRAESATHVKSTDNLYLGLPFCLKTEPAHCGFCLFPTQDFKGKSQLADYLACLEREANIFGDLLQGSTLSSIYVGGGTPNLMRDDDYARTMRVAERLYGNVPSDIEKTLEGIPQLFTREKIDAIKSAGFNRVSMGVQQMSDELIRYSGRKQTHKQVVDAIADFNAAKLACNVDLIYGWPEQTVEGMLRDLQELVNLGVRHITHYQLNIAGLSAFSRNLRDVLPPIELVIEMYRESVRFLSSSGFRQATVYDWERVAPDAGRFDYAGANEYRYEALLRDPLRVDQGQLAETTSMVGIGYAAISFSATSAKNGQTSWCQMNQRSLSQYYSTIDEGLLPVEREFVLEPEDVKLVFLFQCMQEMKIDRRKYAAIFDTDVVEEFMPIWEELEARGWIVVTDERISFVDIGAFHIPMLQALISARRQEEIRATRAQLDNSQHDAQQ
ncbi:radical SAM protein [Rhizobium leguminosarum]|nr:radical SAM protein [Rhizobium leguminosarum]